MLNDCLKSMYNAEKRGKRQVRESGPGKRRTTLRAVALELSRRKRRLGLAATLRQYARKICLPAALRCALYFRRGAGLVGGCLQLHPVSGNIAQLHALEGAQLPRRSPPASVSAPPASRWHWGRFPRVPSSSLPSS